MAEWQDGRMEWPFSATKNSACTGGLLVKTLDCRSRVSVPLAGEGREQGKEGSGE